MSNDSIHNSDNETKAKLIAKDIIMSGFIATLIASYRICIEIFFKLQQKGWIKGYANDYWSFSKGLEHFQDHWTWVLGVILIAFATIMLMRRIAPKNSGDGVGDVIALMSDPEKYKERKLRGVIAKYLSTLTAILAGATIGFEGPAIYMGAMIGEKTNQLTKVEEGDRHYNVGSGAAAGMTAAFGIPLTAIVFSLEEIYGKWNRKIFVTTAISAFTAVIIANLWMALYYWQSGYKYYKSIDGDHIQTTVESFQDGWTYATKPIYQIIGDLKQLNIFNYMIAVIGVILMAVILGLWSKLFKVGARALQKKTFTLKYPIKIGIAFVLLVPLVIFLPQTIGTGYLFLKKSLLDVYVIKDFGWTEVVMLFTVSVTIFALVMYNVAVGFPGGSTIPMKVIGGTFGLAVGVALAKILGLTGYQFNSFVVVFMLSGMACMLTGIGRTPLMAIVLIVETTGVMIFIPFILIAGVVSEWIVERWRNDKPLCVYSAEEILGCEIHH